jgi:hypothetical protein
MVATDKTENTIHAWMRNNGSAPSAAASKTRKAATPKVIAVDVLIILGPFPAEQAQPERVDSAAQPILNWQSNHVTSLIQVKERIDGWDREEVLRTSRNKPG